jgi:hypothetical protein
MLIFGLMLEENALKPYDIVNITLNNRVAVFVHYYFPYLYSKFRKNT